MINIKMIIEFIKTVNSLCICVAQMVKIPPARGKPKFFPWRRAWNSTPVFLTGKSHGLRSWRATVYAVAEELDTA